jgi:hypothetical protein
MKIFVTNLEIRPLPPIVDRNATGQQKLPPVGLEIKLLSFSPPNFDLVFGAPAEAIATVAAVEQFICRVSRTDFPLHLLPL